MKINHGHMGGFTAAARKPVSGTLWMFHNQRRGTVLWWAV